MNYNIEPTSMQGLVSSISFIILAQFLAAFSLLSLLQGLSYLFAIVLAIDTLTGNPMKSWVQKKLKSIKNAHKKDKSKRSESN
jgi:hypothetical protein